MTTMHFEANFKNKPGRGIVPYCRRMSLKQTFGSTTTDKSKVTCKACAKQLGIEPAVDETGPVTILGTCGVCEREIAVQDGRLVHHGYKRPGTGSIHGDCFGVGYEPYERSTKACEDYAAMLRGSIPGMEKRITDLKSGAVTYIRDVHFGR